MKLPRHALRAVACSALLSSVLTDPSSARGQSTRPAWQLGLELSPVEYASQAVHWDMPPAAVSDSSTGQYRPLVGERPFTVDDFSAFPAELGALFSYAPVDWLAVGARIGFSHRGRQDGDYQSTSFRLGPLLRFSPYGAPDWRLVTELGASYRIVRDGLSGSAIVEDPDRNETPTAVGHGLSALAQIGLQWFISEDISIDPGFRAEASHHTSTFELPRPTGLKSSVVIYRLSVVVGLSIWLGQNPVQSPRRAPASDTRRLFQPVD